MQQDLVSVSVSIPLVDWGVRKGKYNMARNNLNVVKTSARQDEISLDEEVIMTVNDFNIQQNMITSAEEALDLSILAYNETRQRFIIGKADINSLTLSLNRQQEATISVKEEAFVCVFILEGLSIVSMLVSTIAPIVLPHSQTCQSARFR